MDHLSWIDKSNENLAAAQLCFNHGHYNACANRLYYAMFHAGSAALFKNGIKPPKEKIGHDWLQANFSEKLIRRRKLYPAKFRPYLYEAQLVRITADYKTRPISKNNVSPELKKAREFVTTIKKELTNGSES